MRARPSPLVLVSLGIALASGCAPHGSSADSGLKILPPAVSRTGVTGSPIQHVVIIIQENRTFENFFAGYPNANAPMYGYGVDANGHRFKIPLKQITFAHEPNITHSWIAGIRMWNHGKMDGFNKYGHSHPAYAYVDRPELAPYWMMAQQYVLADAMFPTEFGPSYTGHLTLIAGTDNLSPTQAEADFPSHAPEDCDSPPGTTSTFVDSYRIIHWRTGPFPCFTQFRTMADTLDAAGVSWKYYQSKLLNAGIWAPFEAISDVRYGSDWDKDIAYPTTKILTDIRQGKLAGVSWVTPTKADSDHPGSGTDRGPSWVGAIVNAIGKSKYWNSSAIVVVWDDWGGWYDNAAPPQLDFRGLGIRVPCLIVSPYAKRDYVSHTQYEYGSILKFVEEVFNLPPLGSASDGYTDQRSNSIVDSFDFNLPPRAFTPIPTKYQIKDFLREPPSNAPVDDE